MVENRWASRLGARVDRDPDRVVLLVPGYGYSAERPLLHFAAAVFGKHGWTTQEVRWPEPPPRRDDRDREGWFERLRSFAVEHVGPVVDGETAPRIALVGKSMGAFAAAPAADRGLPAVWLTPVLRESPLPADLRRAGAPFLLVGSTGDRSWDAGVARGLGRPIYEVEGADHGLETDDPVASAEILRRVTIAMDNFVGTL